MKSLLVKGHMQFWALLFASVVFALIVRNAAILSGEFVEFAIPLSNLMVFVTGIGVILTEMAIKGNGLPDAAARRIVGVTLFKSLVACVVLVYAITIVI